MHVTRFSDAVPYDAPFHTNVDTRRLQGMEVGETDAFWVGLSIYPPGSKAGPSDMPFEAVYFVVSGEFVLRGNGDTHRLGQYDSVHFVPGDHRELVNESDADAVLAVTIAKPKAD